MNRLMQNMLKWWNRPHVRAASTTRRREAPPIVPIQTPHARYGLPATLQYPHTSIGQLLDQTAARFGHVCAMIYGDSCWPYDHLHHEVNRLAGGLAGLGVRRGDRVLLTLPNCPEFIIGFLAVQKLGAVVVNAGPLMGADDLGRLMQITTPRAVLALDLQRPILHPLNHIGIPRVWVTLKDYQTVWLRMGYQIKLWTARGQADVESVEFTLADLMERSPSRPPTVVPDPDDIALLQPTGGTTGTLKVAELSHRNLVANAAQMACWVRLRHGQERVLGVLPMFHVYGLSTCLMTPLYCGATMLPLTRFNISTVLKTIETYRPTVLPLVPAILEKMSQSLEIEPRPKVNDALADAFILSGAAPLSPQVQRYFQQITEAPVIQGYGLTEASPVTHANPPDDARPGCIGLPFPDTRVRLADLNDPSQDAAPGEAGELCLAGPQIMRGYYRDPAETDRVIHTDEDGTRWLHTGDVAAVDEDGFYRILDRKKEMINHGGLKVYPGRVEDVLRMHPRVTDVAVVGRPDPVHTELVVAVVSMTPPPPPEEHKRISHDLRALCREHLAPYEIPAEIEFLDVLPRNPLGKLQKFRLTGEPGKEVT